jgi:predicted nuclease with TOPRIM domain
MTDGPRLTDEQIEVALYECRVIDGMRGYAELLDWKQAKGYMLDGANQIDLMKRVVTQLQSDLRACEAERDAATQECELLEQEKNNLEDDVEPLNQEISLLKEAVDQLTIDLKRTGWKTIWQLENESCDRAVFIDSKGNSWMSPIELGDFNKPDGASKARLYYVIPTQPPLPEE